MREASTGRYVRAPHLPSRTRAIGMALDAKSAVEIATELILRSS